MRNQFPPTTPTADIATGCVLTAVLHVIVIVVVVAFILVSSMPVFLENIFMGFLVLLGVTQAIYVGPAIYYAYQRGRPNIGKGLLIGAGITLALSAACYAMYNPFTAHNFFR